MTNHTLVFAEVDIDNFHNIVNGTKQVETRAYNESYAEIMANDTITFISGDQTVLKKVLKVHHYKSLEDLLSDFHYSDLNQKATSKQDIKDMYDSYPGYTERIAKGGILAFELSN